VKTLNQVFVRADRLLKEHTSQLDFKWGKNQSKKVKKTKNNKQPKHYIDEVALRSP
jgi:hypothetical protein